MHAYMPGRSIYSELRSFPIRTLVGIVALVAASLTLAFRIRELRRPPRLELGPRAEKLWIVRSLSKRVFEYSEQYGRPIFMLTGVHHISPAESTLYEGLRNDLNDHRIRYTYGDEGFWISWDDGDREYFRRGGVRTITQTYKWPKSAAEYTHARWVAYQPRPF